MTKKNTSKTDHVDEFETGLDNLPKVDIPQESWLDKRLYLSNCLFEQVENQIAKIGKVRDYLISEYGMNFSAWAEAIKLTPGYLKAEANGTVDVDKLHRFLSKLLYAYEVKDGASKPIKEEDKIIFEPGDLKNRCTAFLGAFVKMLESNVPILKWGVKDNSEIGIEFKRV